MGLRHLTLITLGALAPLQSQMARAETDDSVIPSPLPENRYSAMIERSPFSLATPKEEPKAPSFAANLYVAGIGKHGDVDVVSIASRDAAQSTFTLFGAGDSYQGISLVSVQWSDDVGGSKVTIKKGSDTGSIGFNEQVLKNPIAVTPPRPDQDSRRDRGNRNRRISTPGGVSLPSPNVTSSAAGTPAPSVRTRRTIRRPGQ